MVRFCNWTSALCMVASGSVVGAEAKRPNFVVMITDDQRFDALGVVQREQGERGRFPWFQTPNLDRLAAEGARFRNAFVVSSLCSPSRAAYLTGRYNHVNGIANNHTPFDPERATHASLLRKAGYRTGYVGKWHMGGQRGQRPGFDYSASFIGQGQFFDCPFEINGTKTDTQGWVDDVSTDFALSFLQKEQTNPFLLVLGFKSSHGPWQPPERLQNRFANDTSRPPVNQSHRPPYLAPTSGGTNKNESKGADSRAAMQRNYFRTLAGVDENVGRILKSLDELQLADNTVVVFASDNGYYLGDHGLGDKRSAYEESLRIPLLVRYPKLVGKGKILDQMALNIDLAPTILDLAGVQIPAEMQGQSWRPLLTGEATRWRTSYFYEYFQEGAGGPPTILAARTESAKLVKYPGHDDWTELFDLKSDPYEMKNLAGDPAHAELRRTMDAEYERLAKSVDFRIPDYADRPGQGKNKSKSSKTTSTKRGPRTNEFILRYELGSSAGPRIADTSGKGNDGQGSGLKIATGRSGQPAIRFDGQGMIEVANSATLDCSAGPWSFAASVRTEAPTGVILARGGATLGYALYLTDGKPTASITLENTTTTITGEQSITGKWARLMGVVTPDQKLRLLVDDKIVGEKPLKNFLSRDPNDSMQIGADTGSQVTKYPEPARFVGQIESVTLFDGEQPVLP